MRQLLIMPVVDAAVTAVCMMLVIHCTSGQTYVCSSSNSLRLYNPNGNTATEGGMLHICRLSRWRAACDYNFGCSTDGRAACRQLGYSGSKIRSVVMTNSAQYYGSWFYTDRYSYSCSSSSTSLTSCSRSTLSSSYCNSDDQVGLWCMTLPPTVSQCTNGAVRLVGGASSNEGKLEYCYYGAWSPICNSFHDEEATVACKQLGFTNSPKAAFFTDVRFGRLSNFSLFNYIYCSSSGYQNSLSSCNLYDSSCGYRCTQNYGIACYESGHDGCREGAVRLVNSTVEYEGRVEVCSNGVWGTVCGMDIRDAAVICRTKGFGGVIDAYSTYEMFGDGDRPIVYRLYCTGCENDIKLCSRNTYLQFSCARQSVSGVRCHHGCTDGDIRLTGGSTETEGTVEICHNQTWGMVSGLGWGEEDARVTCRQLQLPVDGSRYYSDSPFGKSNLAVLFSSVKCTGSESQITNCATSRLTFEEGRTLVNHIGVAGVSCKQRCPTVTAHPIVVTMTETACPMKSMIDPSEQTHAQSGSSTQNGAVAVSLLAGLSGTLATLTVTLSICMCYSFYKLKIKRSNSPQQKMDNSQLCTTPVTINTSYGQHQPPNPLYFADESNQSSSVPEYENVNF